MKTIMIYDWMYTEYHIENTSEQKVYAVLLYLTHKQPATLCIQDLIGWTLGMSRQTIIRSCNALVKKGLLSMENLAYSTYEYQAHDPKHLYKKANFKQQFEQQQEDKKAVDQNGQAVDQNGQAVDQNGQVVDQNGQVVDQNGQVVDQNGQPLISTNHQIDIINNNINKNKKGGENNIKENDAELKKAPTPEIVSFESFLAYAQEKLISPAVAEKCYNWLVREDKIAVLQNPRRWKAAIHYWDIDQREKDKTKIQAAGGEVGEKGAPHYLNDQEIFDLLKLGETLYSTPVEENGHTKYKIVTRQDVGKFNLPIAREMRP